ncbi:hypothetical protein D3C78_1896580 [compost metagenome]
MVAEQQVRCTLEHHGNFGDAAAQALTGTQVERHTIPPAGVDVHPDRSERLGLRIRRDAVLVQVPEDFLAALPTTGELTPC